MVAAPRATHYQDQSCGSGRDPRAHRDPRALGRPLSSSRPRVEHGEGVDHLLRGGVFDDPVNTDSAVLFIDNKPRPPVEMNAGRGAADPAFGVRLTAGGLPVCHSGDDDHEGLLRHGALPPPSRPTGTRTCLSFSTIDASGRPDRANPTGVHPQTASPSYRLGLQSHRFAPAPFCRRAVSLCCGREV